VGLRAYADRPAGYDARMVRLPFALLALLAGCPQPQMITPTIGRGPDAGASPVALSNCDLGADWKPAEMAAASSNSADEVRVLAWQIDEDDRPLTVHSALLWVKLKGSGYMLVHVYRHPRSDNAWHEATVFDVPYEGAHTYAAPPTRAELDEFSQATWWWFKPLDEGFKLLDARVCGDAWEASFGEPSWRAYPTAR
jgi:hypothetical protein